MDTIHIEPFLDSIVAYLKAQLPDAIAEINQESDDFDLPVVDDRDYWVGGREPLPNYPAIEVAIPDWSLGTFSLGQTHAELQFTVMIRVFARHPSTESDRLYRMLMRYGRAVSGLMLDRTAYEIVGARPDLDSARGFYRFNPETNEREEIIGGALLTFTLIAEDFRA